jgi:hypothetical protein
LDIFDDEQLILNILNTIGNVAEEPRARKKMLKHLNYINRYMDNKNDLIKEQAKITKAIIEWKP